jgi:hypothetical protein
MVQMTEVVPSWLAGAKSLKDILRLAQESESGSAPELLWKRCALAGWWDKELYSRLLENLPSSPDPPSFEDFQNLVGVRSAASGCTLADTVRATYLNLWKREDPELPKTSALLEAYYGERQDADRQFQFLLLARPEDGLKRFLELYAASDRGFDLGRCEALLRVLRGQYELLSDGLRNALNDREQYLQSREIFAADYYRSLVYKSRTQMESACDVVLRDAPQWIVNLYGQGGLGKTMFVRRLIAHRCLPEFVSDRIPVARVDLDFADLSLLAHHPWLLLLEAARQLRPQLPRSPFATLLGPEQLGLARLLRTKPSAQRAEDRKLIEISSYRRRDSIEELFVMGMAGNRALLIIDTLEEFLLHRPQSLANLLDVFCSVRDHCQGFRVLLSGRYRIRDPKRKPPPLSDVLHKRLDAEMLPVQITAFTKDESRDYLRDERHLDNPEVVNAIVERSGNPFELSLFADLTKTRPLLTVDDVKECPDVKLAYLVERVIDRMPDEEISPDDPPDAVRKKQVQFAARWLVRYAVIPQELTLDFVKKVLLPFLEDEMSGKTMRDQTKVAGYEDSERWRRQAVTLDDKMLDEIWNELAKYASTYNWLEGDENTLQLHAEVVIPMRELLRQKPKEYPIYDQLHEAAATYFESLAGPPRGPYRPEGGQHLSKALYHRFQIEGSGAKQYWDRYRAICRGVSTEAVLTLAKSILNTKDYLDDERRPLAHFRAGELIDRVTLANVSLEYAHAALLSWLRSLSPKTDQVVNAMNRGLEDWRHFGGSAETAPSGWFRLLDAAQAVCAKEAQRARELLDENWIVNVLDPEDKVASRLLLLRVLPRGQTESDWQYLNALETGKRHPLAAFPEHFLLMISGQNQVGRDTATAMAQLDRACDLVVRNGAPPAEAGLLVLWFGDLAYANGNWWQLARYCRLIALDPKRFPSPALEFACDWLLRCYLDLWLFEEARGLLGAPVLEPLTVAFRAQIAAATFRFAEAAEQYSKAEELYDKRSLLSSAVELRLQQARMFLESMGYVRRANSILRSIGDLVEDVHRVTAYLLRIRLAAASGSADQAREYYLQSLAELEKSGAPEVSAMTARATFLAAGLGDQADRHEFLVRLQKLPLASSRYAALRPFVTMDPWVRLESSDAFRNALPEPEESSDWFLHNLAFAAACRYFGDRDRLEQSVRKGIRHATSRDPRPYKVFALRALIPEELAHQLPPPPGYVDQWTMIQPPQPSYARVAYLQEAEQACYRGELQSAEELLSRYAALPADTLKHQWSLREQLLRARLCWTQSRREEAEKALLEGRDLASEMGNAGALRAFEDASERIRRAPVARSASTEQQPEDDECRIFAAPGGLNIECKSPDGSSGNHIATSRIAQIISDSFDDLFPEQLARMLSRNTPPDLVSDLWEIVSAGGLRKSHRVRLRIPVSAASSTPWEMASWTGRELVIYRSSALPVAASTPLNTDFQGPPTVMVIHGAAESERYSKRGYGVMGLRVADFYKEAGMRVETTVPESSVLRGMLLQLQPHLIHIATGLRDSTNPRDVFLDASYVAVPTSPSRLITPSVLGGVIEQSPGFAPRPLVVLDTYWDPEDHARQVLLRNYFAAALFESVTITGVLAAGDYPPDEMPYFLKLLAGELAGRPTMVDLHAALMRKTKPLLPPALFTNHPDMKAW